MPIRSLTRSLTRSLLIAGVVAPLAAGCAALPTAPSAGGDVVSSAAPSSAPNSSAAILTLTNQQRAAASLQPLVESPALDRAAAILCNEIAQTGVWSHDQTGTSYPEPQDRATAAGYTWRWLGENLAGSNGSDPQHIMSMWMNSPEHRANILGSSYTEIGVAQQQIGGMVCSVQVFGAR